MTQLTSVPANQDADKPAWSPDSQTIYYGFDVDNTAGVSNDIYKQAATSTLGAGATPVVTGVTDDYQPAVSADGQNLCFTRGAFGTASATIQRSTVAGANVTAVATSGNGDYNCVWSPDGTKIAYVTGVFAGGALVVKSSDGIGVPTLFVNDVTGRFDGNPDWAINASPTCPNSSVTTVFGQTVSVPLSCPDQGPAYEQTPTTKAIVTPPAHGTLGSVQPGEPATATYTPNVGFFGTDSFTFKGNDGTSDSNVATVTIMVNPAPLPPLVVISLLKLKPNVFAAQGKPVGKRKRPHGTTVTYRDSQAATSTFTVLRCLRPRCVRYTTVGSFTHKDKAGANSFRFTGRLRGRKLKPGSYRLRVVPRFAGRAGKAVVAGFRIVL